MRLHFLEAADGRAMSKRITPQGRSPMPFAKRFNSHAEEVPHGDLQALKAALAKHAAEGRALMNGQLRTPLEDEDRKGKALKGAPLELACFDIDDLPPDKAMPQPPFGPGGLKAMANEAIRLVFGGAIPCGCVAHASPSCGVSQAGLRLRLFLPLSRPLAPADLKLWITHLNLTSGALVKHVQLTDTGLALKLPLDPSAANTGGVLFLAPPSFADGARDPFPNPDDRWAVLSGIDRGISPPPEALDAAAVDAAKRAMVSKLRKQAGLPAKQAKTAVRNVAGGSHEVLSNPDRVRITVVDDSDEEFVRCNVNDGDSRGYYFLRSNPRWMLNFKDEPIWEIAKAYPDFAKEAGTNPVTPDGSTLKPLVIRDFRTDRFLSGLLNESTGKFDYDYGLNPIAKQNFTDFLLSHGEPLMPEFVPEADVTFDPTKPGAVDRAVMPWRVNLYEPSPLRANPKPWPDFLDDPDVHDCSMLRHQCPHLERLLLHVLGDDADDVARFLNWLAVIWQTGMKVGTAWIMSGTYGTGKGLLADKVLRPLFGERQVVDKELANLEDNYNAYIREAQFIVVHEFRAANARQWGTSRMGDRLRQWITDRHVTLRGMRADPQQVETFCNFLFYSNYPDAIKITPGDRRYNVGTRQETAIKHAIPNHDRDWVPMYAAELPAFAGFLDAFRIDLQAARTPHENEARARLQVTGETALDELTNALHEGDFSWFEHALDLDPLATFGKGIHMAQDAVWDMAADVEAGMDSVVPMEALRQLFHLLTNRHPQITPRWFAQELKRRGLDRGQHVGRKGRVRGLKVRWSGKSKQLALDRIKEAGRGSMDDGRELA